jgi:hypothetical protein
VFAARFHLAKSLGGTVTFVALAHLIFLIIKPLLDFDQKASVKPSQAEIVFLPHLTRPMTAALAESAYGCSYWVPTLLKPRPRPPKHFACLIYGLQRSKKSWSKPEKRLISSSEGGLGRKKKKQKSDFLPRTADPSVKLYPGMCCRCTMCLHRAGTSVSECGRM